MDDSQWYRDSNGEMKKRTSPFFYIMDILLIVWGISFAFALFSGP